MQMASRTQLRRDTPWLAERIGGWAAATWFTRCAFFVLGLFAAGLIATLLNLLHVRSFLFISGLLLVGLAEWLIVKRRFFGTGVEEALVLAGLLMIAFDTVSVWHNSSNVRTSLLITLMLLVAGLRLLNPLFITLSVMAFSATIDFTWEYHGGRAIPGATLASAYCLAVAVVALYLNRVKFRRPSCDQTLSWLIVAMPLAAFLWFETQSAFGSSIASFRRGLIYQWMPVLLLAVFGFTALMAGIRRRSHAPILAFMVCAGCVAYELRHLTTLSLQAKLIGYGGVLLLLTIAVDRYLRTPRRGITSTQCSENGDSLDLSQLAAVSGLTPASAHHPGAPFKGGGGTFGGGGASGNY